MPDILVVLELTGEFRISQKLDVTFSKLKLLVKKKIGFIRRVDKGQITIVGD